MRRRPAFALLELLVVLGIPAVLFGLLLVALQKAPEAANRVNCSNNLRQLGFAATGYNSAHSRLPRFSRWTDSRYFFAHAVTLTWAVSKRLRESLSR